VSFGHIARGPALLIAEAQSANLNLSCWPVLLATSGWAIIYFHTFTVWLKTARTYSASMWVSPTFDALRLALPSAFYDRLVKER